MNRTKPIATPTAEHSPMRPRSGEKYQTEQGFVAIKDGLKPRQGTPPVTSGRRPSTA